MKKILALTFCLTLVFTACARDQEIGLGVPDMPVPTETTAEAQEGDEDQTDTQATYQADGDPITVFLPATMNAMTQEMINAAYLSRLMRESGQRVHFEIYYWFQLRELLNSEENSIFVVSQSDAIAFQYEGLIGNFYEVARQHAPQYLEMASQAFTPGDLYIIPTEIRTMIFAPAVYIRHDIYEAWQQDGGQAISNIRDYEELLVWISGRGGNTAPGLFLIPTNWWDVATGFLPLEFFLEGYTSLTGMFIIESGLPTPLFMNNESGEIRTFTEMPEAVEAMLQPLEWRDRGLFEFWSGDWDAELGSEFPTIALNLAFHPDLDLDAYGIHLLAPTATQILTNAGWGGVAVATPDTDTTPFFEFLEWLTVPDNFRILMYGEEGVDHTVNANGFVEEILNNRHYAWHGRIFFRNDDVWSKLHYLSAEQLARHEFIENIPPPVWPLDAQQRQTIARQLALNYDYTSAIFGAPHIMQPLFSQIYGGDMPIAEARGLVEETFRQIGEAIGGVDLAQWLLGG